MNVKEAKKVIKENIRGYKLQRTNDIYNELGIDPIIRAYNVFQANIPAIQKEALMLSALLLLSIYGLSYINAKNNHVLTDEIERLLLIDGNLENNNLLENVSKEEFEEELTMRLIK